MRKGIIICLILATTFIVKAQTTIPDKPEVILVKGGTFTMGSSVEKDATPPHTVTLSSYSIGKYAVTVGQYKKYCTATGATMPDLPNWFTDKHTIINVNYNDAVSYCNWLGEQYGGDWLLPSEAQWEFAARGGNKSKKYIHSGSDDLFEVAWYWDNAGSFQAQPVGGKKPNELGIYDMSGNVWEWCKDWYGAYSVTAETNPKGATTGTFRVLRGGSWSEYESRCRVVSRDYGNPANRNDDGGFRVVLSK